MWLSCGGHMHAHVDVHACVLISFRFFRWKHSRMYASLMCMTVSVLCLSTCMSMHDSCQHTRALRLSFWIIACWMFTIVVTVVRTTCRDHWHTLELRWWRVWGWFALDPQTNMHTIMHTVCACVCACKYVVCLLCWVYLTAVCLSLCFSSIQAAWFVQQPVVGPVSRHFCRAFIASVSACVSRGCFQSTVLEWNCWMCVRVCTYECIWQLFDLTSNVCCTWIAPQHCTYKHQDARTDMSRRTDRQTQYGLAK